MLSTLDNEIIEADAIHKDLLDQISVAKRQLRQAERDATFQVAVVTDLQNDVKDLQEQYTKLEASRIFSTQEKERLDRLVITAQTKLDTINNESKHLEPKLAQLKVKVATATKNLDNIGKQDKLIRESLAAKELKLHQEESSLQTKKSELKQEQSVNQQFGNRPKPNNSRGYYKI